MPTPCPALQYMGDHTCHDADQCFEPCGHLGHSEEHAVPAPAHVEAAVNAAFGKIQIGPLDV